MKTLGTTIIGVAALLLLVCACMKEESGMGYLEYKNETGIDCTVRIYSEKPGKADLLELEVPAGETGLYFGEIYYMGSCVLGRYGNASIEFSDGSRIEYTKGDGGVTYDGKIGNLLLENNYTVREVDGKFHLLYKITEDIYNETMKP